ncbi:TadE family type IV pilus minor pilin [Ruania zhangjianzhongii]|uniref:TadE family type IV pilus minor pilin n=1 Tax=Ruania zhangjianzhongii TaxID=2603206 RepID=UPI0016525C52|nr:TadE family type IV pilus minor pilin [Ruania zhangjianzhongii]
MTAELAVLLPGVVLAIVVILVVASAGVMQVRCADAARAGARAAALGEDEAEVAAIVQHLAGDDAQVTITRSEEWVDVRVSAEVPLGPLSGVLHTDVVFSALPEPTGSSPIGTAGGGDGG